MKSLRLGFLFSLLFLTFSAKGFAQWTEKENVAPPAPPARLNVEDLFTTPPKPPVHRVENNSPPQIITVPVAPDTGQQSPARQGGFYEQQMKKGEELRREQEKWTHPKIQSPPNPDYKFVPLPELKPQQDPEKYEDPKGRFKLLYGQENPLLKIEDIVKRLEKAWDKHDQGFMGKFTPEEPIIVLVGTLELEDIPKHEKACEVSGVSCIQYAHYLMKINPSQASTTLFSHELVHLHMFTEGYTNIPFWMSEGYAHLGEAGQTTINHTLWMYVNQSGMLTPSMLNQFRPQNDNYRHRGSGWVMAFYYENCLCLDWKDVAKLKTHVDPQVAWQWVQDYAEAEKLNRTFSKMKARNSSIPLELMTQASKLRSKGFEVMQANWDFSPQDSQVSDTANTATLLLIE